MRLIHCPRGSQGPLGISPGHPHRCFRFGAILALCFLARCGAHTPRGQNKGFPRSGRMQGSTEPKRCGPGAPNGPFGWPHSRFGPGQYLNSDPPFGHPEVGLWGRFGVQLARRRRPTGPLSPAEYRTVQLRSRDAKTAEKHPCSSSASYLIASSLINPPPPWAALDPPGLWPHPTDFFVAGS